MYKIEKRDFGFMLTFSDYINEEEMRNWVEESKVVLQSASKVFGIFIDMRTLKVLSEEAQKYMQEGQKLYKEKGMSKSVVILASALTKMQFKRIGQETGIYQWERYLDVGSTPNWEEVGINWVQNGIDPDK